MTPQEKIARLESLLARVTSRAAEPRAAKPSAPRTQTVSFTPPAPSELPPSLAHAIVPAPPARRELIEEHDAPNIEVSHVDAVSGEFEVAEMALELEELGPADEVHDEPVVEIEVEEEPHVEERASEPPASGRSLVASPHESSRVPVAGAITEEEHGLELHEEPSPPPESARNLRVAPSIPLTSEVVPLDPAFARSARSEEDLSPEPEAIAQPIAIAPFVEPEPEAQPESVPPLATATFEPEPEPIVEAPAEPEAIVEAPAEPESARVAAAPEVIEEAPDSEPPATQYNFVPEVPSRHMREEGEPAGAALVEAASVEASAVAAARVEALAFDPAPPAPIEVAPVAHLQPPPPREAVVAVALAAPTAHAKTVEQVVSIEAAVIIPDITPAEIASFVTAVRTFKPESFGVLLDAALDL